MEQQIINWLFAGFGAAVGWILKVIWDAIRDLKNDLRAIEKDLPEVYVRKDDWREAMKDMKDEMRAGLNKIDETLNHIFSKLDRKEDKG